MATLQNPDIVKTILENGGAYPGDPKAERLYVYLNDFGRTLFALYMRSSHDDIMLSPFVLAFRPLWTRDSGLTEFGKYFLEHPKAEYHEIAYLGRQKQPEKPSQSFIDKP